MKLSNCIAFITIVSALGCDPQSLEPEDDFLFGLTEVEIRDAVAHYSPEADADHVVDQLRAPFDCTRFGAACATMGEDEAYDAIESMWLGVRDGMEREALLEGIELVSATAPSNAADPAVPVPVPVPAPIPLPVSSAETWESTTCWVGDTEYLVSLGVTVSDLGLIVRGDASFTGTTYLHIDHYNFVGPLGGDYVMAGALRPVPGSVIASRVALFPGVPYGTFSMSAVSFAGSHEMWGRVELDMGGSCGIMAVDATATL